MPDMVRKFASTAAERMCLAGGGYRRGQLRGLAQRSALLAGRD
jgi:hypothetical protein